MKGKIFPKINLLLILLVVFYSNGCTVTFGLIGNAEDRKTPDIADTVSGWEAEKLKLGSQVIVNLKDGTIVEGKYLGTESIPNEQYDEKYAELQRQMPEGSFLPSKGDTITLSSKNATQKDLRFYGFDNENILLGFIKSSKTEKINLERIENIKDKHGNIVEGEVIRNLMSDGRIPNLFLSRIFVEEHTKRKDKLDENIDIVAGKKFIYIDDIDQIQIKAVKHATRNALITGILIDTAIIVGYLIWFGYGLAQWYNSGSP